MDQFSQFCLKCKTFNYSGKDFIAINTQEGRVNTFLDQMLKLSHLMATQLQMDSVLSPAEIVVLPPSCPSKVWK